MICRSWVRTQVGSNSGCVVKVPDGRVNKMMASQGHEMYCSGSECHGFKAWLGRTLVA